MKQNSEHLENALSEHPAEHKSPVAPMDPRTLRALKGSIAKWKAIEEGHGIDSGPQNCPLCQLFYYLPGQRCKGCPVSVATGQDCCGGSPYDFWGDVEGVGTPEEQEAAARAEREFLESLLPGATVVSGGQDF